MVIPSCEDVHQGVSLVEHIMHGFILFRLRQEPAVGGHAVKLFPYDPHDGQCVSLPPFVVVAFRPAAFPYLVLVVQMVEVVDKPYDDHGVEIVPAIEELSLHMLEACLSEQPLCHLAEWGEAV